MIAQGIWPKPGRVIAINPDLVRQHKMGVVRREQLRRKVEQAARMNYNMRRPR